MSYPPQLDYDPFPVEPEKRHFETPWFRSSQRHNIAQSTASVDELISAFYALSLGEDDATVSSAPRTPRGSSIQRFVLGFTTPCPRAPHPALVRRPRRVRGQRASGCTPNLTAVFARPAAPPRPPTRNSPSLTPSPSSDWSSAQRKRRTLPRRVPKNPSIHHQSPERMSSNSIADRNTRASSLDSVSTSSTSGSDADSPLHTPRLLPSLMTAGDLSPIKLTVVEPLAAVNVADILSVTSTLEWYHEQEPSQFMHGTAFLPSDDPHLAALLSH
ncbi:hypothetical protein K466DRAFT_353524 [Polyporus arcularius HHB13444]|uniref:Uncharacterized protein n=1 Tax=Polyporus arcularius HHB13444 TaxID=1314778 RepID=A0A5C3PXF2_9APHY|nr:hypothetical protein K466DRAFT_353524 [Polyporus arcularius HHB13444]